MVLNSKSKIYNAVENRIFLTVFLLFLAIFFFGFVWEDLHLQKNWDPVSAHSIFWVCCSFLGLAVVVLVFARRYAVPTFIVLYLLGVTAVLGLAPVLTVFLFLGACLLLGDLVSGYSRRADRTGLVPGLVNVLAGVGLYIGGLQTLLHFPVNTRFLYLVLLAAPFLLNHHGAMFYARRVSEFVAHFRFQKSAEFWAAALFALFVLVHSLQMLLPETGFDALLSHLMIPFYVRSHAEWGFDFRSFSFATWPLGGDLTYTIGVMLGGEMAAKLINFSFFLLGCSIIYSVLRTYISRAHGLLATALYASTPVIQIETASLYIENLLAALIAAGFAAVCMFRERFTARDAFVVAVLLGAMIEVKATAGFAIPTLGLIAVFLLYRQSELSRRTWVLVVCLLIVSGIGLQSYAYAYYSTGNPVNPMFNKIFQSEFGFDDWNFIDKRWVGKFSWDVLYQMTFQSNQFLESMKGALGFQYLIFFPLGFLVAIRRADFISLTAVALTVIYIAGVFSFTQYIRYAYPVFPIAAIVLTLGYAHLAQKFRLLGGAIVVLVVGVSLLNLYFLPAAGKFRNYRLEALASGNEMTSYLEARAPVRILIEIVNATAGKNARVAFLGKQYGAGLSGFPIYIEWYNKILENRARDATLFNEWFKTELENRAWGASTPDVFRALIEDFGITHFIFSGETGAFDNKPLVEYLKRHSLRQFHSNGAALYTMRILEQ